MPIYEPQPTMPLAARTIAVATVAFLALVAAPSASPASGDGHAAPSQAAALPATASMHAVAARGTAPAPDRVGTAAGAAPALPATAAAARADVEAVTRGRKVAFDRGLGNCLACHTMKGGDVPSDVGPELANLAARYPDPHTLYTIIYDEQQRNPQTVMPPFGRNLILSPQQISDVVAFLYTE